jgi:hypothetical protein
VRDAGLERAIDAAGGIAQLARKIGIAQPSVSNWTRVPAQRVIAVEGVTGVSRKVLRPDLFSEPAVTDDAVDPIDAGRAEEYALLATLLSSAPSAALLGQIAQLKGDATPLGRAHAALAEAASIAVATEVDREYFELFVGLGRGELLPYASYYLTGFLNERPLSRLRDEISSRSASSGWTTILSPRITRRRCARSWRAARRRASRHRPKHSAPSSRSMCPAGWDVCLPTWRRRKTPSSTGRSERSDGFFWR